LGPPSFIADQPPCRWRRCTDLAHTAWAIKAESDSLLLLLLLLLPPPPPPPPAYVHGVKNIPFSLAIIKDFSAK
jgi:hypothetical protein